MTDKFKLGQEVLFVAAEGFAHPMVAKVIAHTPSVDAKPGVPAVPAVPAVAAVPATATEPGKPEIPGKPAVPAVPAVEAAPEKYTLLVFDTGGGLHTKHNTPWLDKGVEPPEDSDYITTL